MLNGRLTNGRPLPAIQAVAVQRRAAVHCQRVEPPRSKPSHRQSPRQGASRSGGCLYRVCAELRPAGVRDASSLHVLLRHGGASVAAVHVEGRGVGPLGMEGVDAVGRLLGTRGRYGAGRCAAGGMGVWVGGCVDLWR